MDYLTLPKCTFCGEGTSVVTKSRVYDVGTPMSGHSFCMWLWEQAEGNWSTVFRNAELWAAEMTALQTGDMN